jgi:hypothetical protein
MLAIMWQQGGGTFAIDSNGKRHLVSEVDAAGDLLRVSVMLEGVLNNLHPDDQAVLFDAFAACAVDPDSITASFDEPMRRAA